MTTQPAPYPDLDGTQPCATTDPELFFPATDADRTDRAPLALACCRSCPLMRPCAAYALTHAVHGVWGATTEEQRDQLRTAHGITAVPITTQRAAEDDLLVLMERGGASPSEVAARLGTNRHTVSRRAAALRERPETP